MIYFLKAGNLLKTFRLLFLTGIFTGGLFIVPACQQTPAQNKHPRAPEPGTYSSSMMTSWLTVTPYSPGDPRTGTNGGLNVDYGVGSTSFKGLFGDLVLHANGTYSLTKDTHTGTWKYIPANDSVALTGYLSTFKTKYNYGNHWIVIYTGDVKMPDGGTLNISYTKQRKKPYTGSDTAKPTGVKKE